MGFVCQDHLNGKQYLGWLAIREKFKEMQQKYGDKPLPQSVPGHGRDRNRSRDRDRERDRCVVAVKGWSTGRC